MNRMDPICWSSKKLDNRIKSPLSSETLVFSEAADAGKLIAAMLQEKFRIPRLPEVHCKTDNVSLAKKKSLNLVNDWWLKIDVAKAKEIIAKKDIQIE